MYADVSGLAAGTIVELRGVSVDSAGVKHAASTYASVEVQIDCNLPPAPPGPTLPKTVSIPGDLNFELGCAADWSPECTNIVLTRQSDGAWTGTFDIPKGSWQFKIAVNGSWEENYGADGVPGGGNIPLTVQADVTNSRVLLRTGRRIWSAPRWMARSPASAGDFQSELGCLDDASAPADWKPSCLAALLRPTDDPNMLRFDTDKLAAISWSRSSTT